MSRYKVGDKVVLTVSDVNEKVYYPHYEFNNNFNLWEESIDKLVEPLSTYTKPLEAKISRQAAEITRLLAENKRLKAENGNVIWEIEQAFDRGCNEAWELVRKIFDMETNDIEDIFIKEDAWNLGTVLNNYTYQEAAAKVAEWGKAKEEIKVGDVVSHEEKYGVVISEGTICFRGFTDYGTPFEWYKERCTKTGRHIDIDSFLKQIGEEE